MTMFTAPPQFVDHPLELPIQGLDPDAQSAIQRHGCHKHHHPGDGNHPPAVKNAGRSRQAKASQSHYVASYTLLRRKQRLQFVQPGNGEGYALVEVEFPLILEQ